MAQVGNTPVVDQTPPQNDVKSVVYTWGTGRSGEMGHNNLDKSQNSLLPSPITFFTKKLIQIRYVSCGEGYSCAITSSDQLYTWGIHYKLGIGHLSNNQKSPKLVAYFVENNLLIDKVSCGECHMGVITKNNHKLFLWGKSENGCIGDGNPLKHNVLLPYNVSINNNIHPIDIDLGWKTSAVITSDFNVYSWGCSSTKVLGHKNINQNYIYPTKINFIHSKNKDDIKNNNDNTTNININQDVNIVNISFGSHHAAAVTDIGDVYIWGNNSWYNLGFGNNKNKRKYCQPQLLSSFKYFNNEKIVSISCTKSMLTPVKGAGKEGLHTMCVSSVGHLYCFGAGHKGKCANLIEKWGFHLKGKEDIRKPYLVGSKSYDTNINTNYFRNIKIIQCCAGAIHSGVVDNNGKVWTFGCGSDGRMGLKAYVDGSCGAGKQVYKFYVSKPTKVEVLDDNKSINIKQIQMGRRHMIALGYIKKPRPINVINDNDNDNT